MPYSSDQPTFWQRSLGKIGIGGTAFAALCCLGFPALLTILSMWFGKGLYAGAGSDDSGRHTAPQLPMWPISTLHG